MAYKISAYLTNAHASNFSCLSYSGGSKRTDDGRQPRKRTRVNIGKSPARAHSPMSCDFRTERKRLGLEIFFAKGLNRQQSCYQARRSTLQRNNIPKHVLNDQQSQHDAPKPHGRKKKKGGETMVKRNVKTKSD